MNLHFRSIAVASALCFLSAGPVHAQKQAAPILITADLSEAPRKVFHAEIDLPVKPGPVALITPKWIPGTHQPFGPVNNIVGVVFTANGKTLEWRRDDVELYEFHVTVPAGVTTLHAHLDCLVPLNVSRKVALLDWESLMLYPASTPVRDIAILPSVIVPAGWSIGTALTPASNGGTYPQPAPGSTTKFAVTNVEQLEDSPVLIGQNFREFAVAPDISPKHFVDVASDQPGDCNLSPTEVAGIANLVREADALYKSHHYNQYHFLIAMSDFIGTDTTLEHGQSSEYGVAEKDLSDEAMLLSDADLLPHEYTHSWNGKYRRPAGLYQPDFATMQQGALLWVYEGMTQYLGNVLAARAGLKTPAQYRELLAWTASLLDYTPGREWRSTVDTAISASVLRSGDTAWADWRRGQDYYDEGQMVWLDADTLIRKLTNNQKSLDDFEDIFLGKGGNTGPLIVTYTFDELVQDLNQVAPYDWAGFFRDRVMAITPHVDLNGIERGGYKLVYLDHPTASETLVTSGRRGLPGVEAWYSAGLFLGAQGEVAAVRWNGPAAKAKLTPGDKIIAVNGQVYSGDRFRAALRSAKNASEPIHLTIQSDTLVSAIDLDYHDGERYPALERVEGAPAYLDDIIKPLSTAHETAPTPAANDH